MPESSGVLEDRVPKGSKELSFDFGEGWILEIDLADLVSVCQKCQNDC